MSWQTLEERELGLDPRLYTKKAWNPQDFVGYHKTMGPRPKTKDEVFKEENGWDLVDENDENRFIEDYQRSQMMQPDAFSGSAFTEHEIKNLRDATLGDTEGLKREMMRRLSGL